MACDNRVRVAAGGLKHIYFFIDQSASDDETTTSADGSMKHHSRTSSPGSNNTEAATTVSSSSELNPLATPFKPRFDDSEPSAVPPAPSATQIFELRRTTDKGLGLFATSFIPRGTLILQEEPLLGITRNEFHLAWGPYSRLGNAQNAAYDSLHSYQPENANLENASRLHLLDPNDESLDEDDIDEFVSDHVRVMSIFSVNNFRMVPSGLAVYATASRLNHSCVPNVHHSYNPTVKRITVYAVNDIEPEQELFTSYLGGEGNYSTRSQRIEKLRATYGFTCRCPACTDPTKKSDGRRELMNSIAWGLQQFEEGAPSNNAFIPASPLPALKQAEDLISIMLQEGLVTIELSKAYRYASKCALRLKDYHKAVEYACNEAEVRVIPF